MPDLWKVCGLSKEPGLIASQKLSPWKECGFVKEPEFGVAHLVWHVVGTLLQKHVGPNL